MIERHISAHLMAALTDTPVVFLHGARQTGKSTLVQHIARSTYPARYLTLDDMAVQAAAETDPVSFLAGLQGPVVLDEIQRAPGLLRALKAEIDRERRPGRFLLTGSAHVMVLPEIAQSLVGRMETLTLWPLAQEEIEGRSTDLVDRLFASHLEFPAMPGEDRATVLRRALIGGFPEVISRSTSARRQAWFGSYLTTILQRDVRDLANIESLSAMPRLLSLIAARAGGLLNGAELSRDSGLPQTTLRRYLALLEHTFLVQFLPAWSGSLSRRLVKSPKVFLTDSGLLGYLLGLDEGAADGASPLLGQILENFVAMELQRQITWSAVQPRMLHFRAHTGQEVDLVLEDRSGQLVGIEVKAASTVGAGDFASLRFLAQQVGDRLLRGIVLYTGREAVPFGTNLYALPVSALWA